MSGEGGRRGYARRLTPDVRAALVRAGADPGALVGADGFEAAFEAAEAHATLARRLAEESVDQLRARLPVGPADLLPGVDLTAALTARLTLRLFLHELGPLTALLRNVGDGPGLVLADTGLTDAQLAALQARPDLPVPRAVTTTPRRPWAAAWRTRARRLPVTELPNDAAVVALCGNETDLPFLLPLLGRGDVVLAKTDRPEARRACEVLGTAGVHVVTRTDFLGLRVGRDVRGQLARARQLPPDVRRGGLGTVAREFERLAEDAARFAGLCGRLRPTTVLGALERSPFGGIVSALRPLHGYRAVNVQHGTVLPAGVMDLLDLDLCLAWNDWSVRAYRRDGFQGRCVVVGNPRWDQLASTGRPDRRVAERAGPVVVAFPQPVRGPYLTESVVSASAAALADLLHRREDVSLVVKERSRTPAFVERRVLEPLRAAGRVHFADAASTTLEQALAQADLAVSVYSTALADACAAGVHAVSVDPCGVGERLSLDVLSVVPVCRDAEDLERELERALRGAVEPAAGAARVFPSFDRPYADRVAAALALDLPRGIRPGGVRPGAVRP